MGNAVRRWVVNPLEEEIAAVHQDDGRLAQVPAWMLPAGTREGHVPAVEPAFTDGVSTLRTTLDRAATHDARRRAREHLARALPHDPGGDTVLYSRGENPPKHAEYVRWRKAQRVPFSRPRKDRVNAWLDAEDAPSGAPQDGAAVHGSGAAGPLPRPRPRPLPARSSRRGENSIALRPASNCAGGAPPLPASAPNTPGER